MTLHNFTNDDPPESFQQDEEIFNYINDERILRVLFEQKIFALRDIQKKAIEKGLFFRKSFLICSPSGSGKTLIAEICAFNNIFNNYGKSIYLVPFKALATEKYYYFKKYYERFKVNLTLSIGDYDIDDSELKKADLVITTYEKCDSILRNFYDKAWIHDISTIIIDEIHLIGESDRGPRLESLIVRLNEFLHQPQIIGLSATIANPKLFNDWLTSLGNDTILIQSEVRPVPLHYQVVTTQNKDSTIKKIVKQTLDQKGQVLVFLNKRKSTQQTSFLLKNVVKNHIEQNLLEKCRNIEKKLAKIKGGHKDLKRIIKYGISFHHAGLLPKERKLVEDGFRKRILKVVCATTTLSAGINTPSRVVVLRDFKKYVTSGHNLKNFSGYHENGDGFSYFKPFSANEVFQMLGRAGRPGLDSVGYGIILVNNLEERNWVENNHFQSIPTNRKLIPLYNNLVSSLNRVHTLKEQVLLRIYEEGNITIEQLKKFFERTYFWFLLKQKMRGEEIPIEQILMIQEITPENILKLHADSKRLEELNTKNYQIKLTKVSNSLIGGYLKTEFGVFMCQFGIEHGIGCSCGFQNGISDNFVNDEFVFEFCDHIAYFLKHLIEVPAPNLQKYVADIIPKSIRNQYILNYLFEKGLIEHKKDGTIRCSQFGKLIIRLYLYPMSGVLIRQKLENSQLHNSQDIIKAAYEVLKAENKVRNYKMLQPILEWTDEIPIEEILERYHILAGDLNSVRDNLERIITFIGIISIHLSDNYIEFQDNMIHIAEMAETLKIRVHYGIKEQLFDLVLHLNSVARVRARIIYNAGYHTATQVRKENPYILNRKTGLGVNLCRKIIKG
ncbi:MAG: DEAD/DEAH box helicase [Candidatus Hodarchaeota archaeon]